ncbi:MAG TPA: hypothetical protein VHG91_07325 [Longimicrobium sp.]|nr:hypothetical protein [Longimicrobium sp.]
MTLRAPRSTFWLLGLLLALAAPAAAQARPLVVSALGPAEGWRAAVQLRGVLRDRALVDALESGLPLRFHFRVELWKKDVIDRLVESREVQRALLKHALDGGYALEDGRTEREVRTLAQAEGALQQAFQPPMRPVSGGRYYYLATLEVETLSLSDLEELRRWLRGEARPAVTGEKPAGRAVETGLRRFFVRLLGLPTRRYEARTGSFTVR